MTEIVTRTHDLSTVEPRLRHAVEILLAHEDILSDGYKYYCEYFASEQAHERHGGDLVVGALEEIVREILG